MNTTETISQVLDFRNWAIVGLANNPDRAAFGVAKLLQSKGHQIFPVHPKAETVHGAIGYSSLSGIPVQIDVVDCFVNSDLVGDVVDQAIAIGARAVWLQLGVIDQAAVSRAQAAGLLTVMDRCPAIEYQRFS
jgi:predicted CoA-binding protein